MFVSMCNSVPRNKATYHHGKQAFAGLERQAFVELIGRNGLSTDAVLVCYSIVSLSVLLITEQYWEEPDLHDIMLPASWLC